MLQMKDFHLLRLLETIQFHQRTLRHPEKKLLSINERGKKGCSLCHNKVLFVSCLAVSTRFQYLPAHSIFMFIALAFEGYGSITSGIRYFTSINLIYTFT